MTPEQIQGAVQTALLAWGGPPWWTYFIVLAMTTIGALIGPYLRRKGENYATAEDFQKLRNQLEQTTRDAETIKHALQGRGWLKQQHWAMREKYYFELLKQLTVLRIGNQDMFEHSVEHGVTNPVDSAKSQEYVHSYMVKLRSAKEELRSTMGPAAVFLSDATLTSIEDLFARQFDIEESSYDNVEYYDRWLAAIATAYRKVLEEAKRDLAAAEFPMDGTPK